MRVDRSTLGWLDSAAQHRNSLTDAAWDEAARGLLGLSGRLQDRDALSRHAQKLLDSFTPGVTRLERAMASTLADRAKLDRALDTPFSSFALTDALANAAGSFGRSPFAGIEFDLMQDTVTRTMGMRFLVDDQVNLDTLSPTLRGIWDGAAGITGAATAVWERWAANPAELSRLPEFLREVPVLQDFEATRSAGLLLIDEPELAEIEPSPGLLAAEADDLPARLRAIDPDLAEKYEGAVDTFRRRGKDYVRQVSVSLRELFVHLFEILAPAPSIKAWDESVLEKKGSVSNKARLKYIYRSHAALGGLAELTDRDIDHVLQNFFVLNAGVHSPNPDLAYEQMRFLIRRCEYGLLTILAAHELTARVEAER